MDSFGTQNVKLEKANAILRYRRRKNITNMFRFAEITLFLIIISRICIQFSIDCKLYSEYVPGLFVSLVSPQLVFLIGNAIIIVLYLKSGQFSSKNNTNDASTLKIHDMYVKTSGKNRKISGDESMSQIKRSSSEQNIVAANEFNKKEIKIHRSKSEQNIVAGNEFNNKEIKIHRSKSGTFTKEQYKEYCRSLRRSKTRKDRRSVDYGEKLAMSSYEEDEMTGEEFRRTVEAFIARQQRSLREE